MGMPALAMTDHGNVFGAYDFYKQATAAGVKPIIGMEAYLTPRTHRSERTRVRWGSGGERRRLRRRRLHPHDAARREHRGHAQPVPARRPGPASRASSTSRGSTASCWPSYADGPDRDHRLPVRRGPDLAAARASTTRRARRPRSSATSSARSNYFLELMDHGLAIETPGPRRPAPAGQGPRPAAGRHQRPALHPHGGRRRRTRCCCACSPARRWTTRTGSSSTATTSTSSRPRRCARCVARAARGLRQHAADRRALRRSPSPRARDLHAAVPGARRARPSSPGSSRRSSAGWPRRYPGGIAAEVRKQGRLRGRASSRRWASRATSWWSPTSSTGPRTTASGSGPGRGSGAGLDGGVRDAASPTSTRSQHGLIFERFLNPERVSMPDFDVDFDERRRGEVIRYVTEKYGDDRVAQIVTYGTIKAKQADQGLRPGARLPVRDRRPASPR